MRTRISRPLAIMALALGTFTFASPVAKADDVEDLYDGLVNVVVHIDEFDNLIYVNDIDVLDYNYVNVADILDDDSIGVLSALIDEDPIASFDQGLLDDILQFNNVLNTDQIVVGVLSDQGIIYYLEGQ